MINKIIAILIALLLPATACASLNFATGVGGVNHGSNGSIDGLTTGITVLAWVYPTAFSQDAVIAGKGDFVGYTNYNTYFIFATGAMYMDLGRATTELHATSATSLVSLNKWQFVGYQIQSGGTDSDQKLFYGDLSTSVQEPAYTNQQVGSGAVSSTDAESLGVGNTVPIQTYFGMNGRIAWVGIWNRVLTLGEIKDQQFNPHKTSGNVLFTSYGYNGTGTQADWSGNLNNGTVTSGTVAPHVPLGMPFKILDQTTQAFALSKTQAFFAWARNGFTNLTSNLAKIYDKIRGSIS